MMHDHYDPDETHNSEKCVRCGQPAEPWRGLCDDCAIEIENAGEPPELGPDDVPWG
jgi:predicted amidophosphoribosyltransferase